MPISILKKIFRSTPKQSFSDFSFLDTDIHSHLIPGIDDGAQSMEESMELIRGLQNIGFKKIITSPHVMMEYYPNTTAGIAEGGNQVNQVLKERGINLAFGWAAEYFLDENFEALIASDDLLTIGENHVLFELSFFEPPRQLREVIFNLKIKGYHPILAHAERYGYWEKTPGKFNELVEAGCSLQLNLLSLLGHYGSKVEKMATLLIREKLYDFAGTDVHRMEHIEKLKRGLDEGAFWLLNDYDFRNKEI